MLFSQPLIILEHLGVSFNKSESCFNEVNLAVRRGEILALIGPNGAGKSVLLKTIAGLVAPTSGRVLIEGVDLNLASREQRAAVIGKMGMLFQKSALFDSLTVAENLSFPLQETTSLSFEEIQKEVNYFLEEVGLKGFDDKYPDEISGGMQKRLAIARAVIRKPKIILYDDPTAGLDPITSRMIIDLILKLKKEHESTVITVTNEMNRAYQMTDQVGILIDKTLKIASEEDPRIRSFIRGEVSFGTPS